jgi:hypothetical protein
MGCLLLACGLARAQQEAPSNGIGYADVGTALADLRANRDAEEGDVDGWTWFILAEAQGQLAMWAFAPYAHPAYPAAVKRTLADRDGALVMETRTLCHAALDACDAMLADTQAHTEVMKQRIVETILANQERMRQLELRRKRQQRISRHIQSMQGRP